MYDQLLPFREFWDTPWLEINSIEKRFLQGTIIFLNKKLPHIN